MIRTAPIAKTTQLLVLAVILFSGLTGSYTRSAGNFSDNRSKSQCFHETPQADHPVYEIPLSLSVNDFNSSYPDERITFINDPLLINARHTFHRVQITSYARYAATLSIGLESTDIIFPFHYFT